MGKRLGIGETSDAGERRSNFSKREANGTINVLNIKKSKGKSKLGYCKYCGHHKFFAKPSGIYCCKCGKKVDI